MPRPRPSAAPSTSLAEDLVARLGDLGVDRVFLVAGSHIDPLLLALTRSPIRAVTCTQELSAGYLAHGHALRTGGIGVCLSMGGPGAANLLPAALCARQERAPVLFLTGGVPPWAEALEAFQDGGPQGGRDLALYRSALPYSRRVARPEDLGTHLRGALEALRRGPAHLQLSYEVLEAPAPLFGPLAKPSAPPSASAAGLRRWLAGMGPRTALLVGEAPMPAGADDTLRAFAETYSLPVATTLGAKGALPEDHPLSLGHAGYGGSPRARAALLEGLDGLLVLGADLGDRNTFRWDPRLRDLGPRLLRIDTEFPAPNAFSRGFRRLKGAWPSALGALLSDAPEALRHTAEARRDWISGLRRIPLSHPVPPESEAGAGLHPARTVTELCALTPPESPLFIDAGAHRLFGAHYWRARVPGAFRSASRTAPMGWGLCAGLGAAFAKGDARVHVLTGDGCMRMHGLELATVAEHGLPVTVVVLNNAAMGNILQRFRGQGPEAEALTRLPEVDWAAQARLLGAQGQRVSTVPELREALATAARTPGPFLLDVRTLADAPFPDPEAVFSPCGPPPGFLP